MRGKKNKIVFGALIACLVLAFAAPTIAAKFVNFGESFPEDQQILKLDGTTVPLKGELAGKKTVMIFFNSTCNQCLAEIKYVMGEYNGQNIMLVGIDMRGQKSIQRWLDIYMKNEDMSGVKIYVDSEFTLPNMIGVGVTPATALVDAEGKLVKAWSGFTQATKTELTNFFK